CLWFQVQGFPTGNGLRQPAAPKGFVNVLLFVPGEHPAANLRVGVIVTPSQPIASDVGNVNQVARLGLALDTANGAREDPGMAVVQRLLAPLLEMEGSCCRFAHGRQCSKRETGRQCSSPSAG